MKTIKFFSIILFTILVNSGCKKEEPIYTSVSGGDIRIGVLLALTGTGYSSGQSSQVSIELARQDILDYLSSIGIQQKITLIMADSKTDTAEALLQVKGFYDQGVRLVIGPYSSAEVLAIKNFADTHGMLIVSPSSVAVSLAIPSDNVFRFVSCDVIQGEAMNKMLVEDKIKTIVPLIRDDLWGKDLLAATQKNFINSGGRVTDPVKFDPDVTDFSDVLTLLDSRVSEELNHSNPDEVGVYMLSFAEGAKVLNEANKYSSLNSVPWFGGSAFAQNASVLNDARAALFAVTHKLPCPVFGLDDAAKYKWEPLIERIRAQIGRTPDVYAITAYDALWVSVRTYLVTGPTPDISMLKKTFIGESGKFFGASGNTLLDENGDRAYGNYDFWSVMSDSTGFTWQRTAKYNSVTGILVRDAK